MLYWVYAEIFATLLLLALAVMAACLLQQHLAINQMRKLIYQQGV